jgi:acetyltransferase
MIEIEKTQNDTLPLSYQPVTSNRSDFLGTVLMRNLNSRVAHNRLLNKCFIDYDREMALVADWANPSSGEREIIAVGRLTRKHDSHDAEVAVLVADKFQHTGLGTELLGRLIQVARDEKLASITAMILPENVGMRGLAAR